MKTSVLLLLTATLFLAMSWDKQRKRIVFLESEIIERDNVNLRNKAINDSLIKYNKTYDQQFNAMLDNYRKKN